MSPNLSDFRACLRTDCAPRAGVAQAALDAAEADAAHFIGTDLVELADSFGDLPADITQAVYLLARIALDADAADVQRGMAARAHALLRFYRVSVGFSEAGAP